MNRKEKVLVTGGAGFIGGHVVDELLNRGYEVVVMDLLGPPTHEGELPEWFNNKAEFIRGDVRDKADWARALMGVTYVFHLAGYMDFRLDFSTYYGTNTLSTALLYEVIAEKKYPIKKIIVASSQAVYGEGTYRCPKCGLVYPTSRPVEQLRRGEWDIKCPLDGSAMASVLGKEDDITIQGGPYSISKRSLEQTALFLGNYLSIPSYVLRYTIVHGPRQSFRHFYSGALRQFVAMLLTNKPLVIHEDGKQRRDFIHINDVVNAHIHILEHNSISSGIYNVGSGRGASVNELAEMVARKMGEPFKPEYPGLFVIGNARHSVEDITKLMSYGWKPTRSLEDNVADYLEWINKCPNALAVLKSSMEEMKRNQAVLKAHT